MSLQSIKSTSIKICPKCKEILTLDDFHKGQGYCKKCQSQYGRERYLKDKNAINRKTTEYRQVPENKLKLWASKYKLKFYQLESLWEAQGRRCPGCNIEINIYSDDFRSRNGVNVDHDHSCCNFVGQRRVSCGKCVRGLLCPHCNKALAYVEDNVETLLNLAEYLKIGSPYPMNGNP